MHFDTTNTHKLCLLIKLDQHNSQAACGYLVSVATPHCCWTGCGSGSWATHRLVVKTSSLALLSRCYVILLCVCVCARQVEESRISLYFVPHLYFVFAFAQASWGAKSEFVNINWNQKETPFNTGKNSKWRALRSICRLMRMPVFACDLNVCIT